MCNIYEHRNQLTGLPECCFCIPKSLTLRDAKALPLIVWQKQVTRDSTRKA